MDYREVPIEIVEAGQGDVGDGVLGVVEGVLVRDRAERGLCVVGCGGLRWVAVGCGGLRWVAV